MAGRLKSAELPYLERSPQLCAVLRKTREQANFSRNELAVRSGVKASTIQKIEDGNSANPGIFTVAALAVALDLDLSDLLRRRTGPLKPGRLSKVEGRLDS
ncbi:multiprotein-bridging factor 1 family protein [Microbacterium sp. P04]|uniref:helix-turn-helix domain-containing protein n=1 Tax=Microbacterium sp. P04 TaxID=3366947 RepID=UPI0037452654